MLCTLYKLTRSDFNVAHHSLDAPQELIPLPLPQIYEMMCKGLCAVILTLITGNMSILKLGICQGIYADIKVPKKA